jgi:Glycosyl hydrolase family 47
MLINLIFLNAPLQMFKNKAVEVANKLMPAFNTPTGIPMAMINIRTFVHFLDMQLGQFFSKLFVFFTQ